MTLSYDKGQSSPIKVDRVVQKTLETKSKAYYTRQNAVLNKANSRAIEGSKQLVFENGGMTQITMCGGLLMMRRYLKNLLITLTTPLG